MLSNRMRKTDIRQQKWENDVSMEQKKSSNDKWNNCNSKQLTTTQNDNPFWYTLRKNLENFIQNIPLNALF